MTPTITIIGAGAAGLAVGIYAQMNGYQTRIYEMHSLPGGLCTAWKRKDYLVDGCIHWLCGSGPGMDMHHYWQELGTGDLEYVNHRAYIHLELPEQAFTLYTDANELEAYLNSIGPEDEDVIHELCQTIRDLAETHGIFDAPEAQDLMNRLMTTNMGELTGRLTNPKLCQAFSILFWKDAPMFFSVFPLSYSHAKSAGYPVGGSLEFAKAIERRYLALGGEVHYNARVDKILVEDDRAVGLRFTDGSVAWEREGDIVSTMDAHGTFYDLLEGKYLNDGIKAWFDEVPVIGSPVMVTLGLDMSMQDAPTSTNGLLFIPASPVVMYGGPVGMINVEVSTYDPTAAPEGKAVARVNLPGNYEFWKNLRADRTAYEAEKERIAHEVISALDHRFPGLAQHVEMVDVATPVTFERYTGNWQGSSQGFIPTPRSNELQAQAVAAGNWPAKPGLPGLEHFYTAGQWLTPFGGLPVAAMTARALVEELCRRDEKAFQII